ncbi:zinc metalloproteinase nas-13-like isoform X2 [Cherax quadricarinatus]|uniref:zinc metalloproteinase nas-13-like isoform X2 n=1 Tax=Cherax quadricarinatus TaxID=27406 RepID=UPI00387E9ED5
MCHYTFNHSSIFLTIESWVRRDAWTSLSVINIYLLVNNVGSLLGEDNPKNKGEDKEDEGGQMPMMVRGDNQQLWPGGNLVYKLDYDVEDNVYGFGHEHNRADRDKYVTINMTNVREGARQYFTKYTWSSGFVGGELDYDYTSIMHATNVYDPTINVDMTKPVIWRNDGGSGQ